MSRYVLRYRGSGTAPTAEIDRLRADSRLNIVDETPRMFLVETTEEHAAALRSALSDWLISEEQVYGHSDPRPKPRA